MKERTDTQTAWRSHKCNVLLKVN